MEDNNEKMNTHDKSDQSRNGNENSLLHNITTTEVNTSANSLYKPSIAESEQKSKKLRSLSFISTNARSLAPKLESAIDCFDELDLDFAVITESWLRDGPQLRKSIDDLKEGRDIDMLTMNRRTRSNKTAGGGIAILFNKNRLTFKEYKIKKGKSEVICATAKIVNTSRQLVVNGAYLKPGLRAGLRAESMLCIKEAIARCKQEMSDPYVIVTGDLGLRKQLMITLIYACT